MTERPLVFRGGKMLGILSEPTGSPDLPVVIILNAGLVYRAGPGRMSVQIARRIARLGFATFRFDLAGIGDSEPPTQPLSSVESATVDTREAMDVLEKELGSKRFVLFGLCSGAVHGHHIAAADPRVVGAAMLDGYVFHTVRSRVVRTLARIRPLRRLPARALRWARRGLSVDRSPALAVEDDGFLPRWPAKEQVQSDLQILGQRRVALLYMFSSEWEAYRYEGQIAAALGTIDYPGAVREVLLPGAEHLCFARPAREMLLETVTQWLSERPWDDSGPIPVRNGVHSSTESLAQSPERGG